jgi:NAD-dependent deacetylase
MKPDIILMEEQLPARTWLKAVESSETCSTMIVAGSSLEVVPVARLPMQAIDHGAHLIIINNSSTYIDPRADVVIHEDLVDIIPAITRKLLN